MFGPGVCVKVWVVLTVIGRIMAPPRGPVNNRCRREQLTSHAFMSREVASASLNAGSSEFLCNACCCSTTTVFVPSDFVQWLGQTSKSFACCFDDANASCIWKSHPQFDQLISGEREGVCMICNTGQTTLVKPLCLTGEKPCLKSVSMGCCASSRMSIPSECVPSLSHIPTAPLLLPNG